MRTILLILLAIHGEPALVERVVDGDTVVVRLDGQGPLDRRRCS
jgi:hypothetical protein